MSDTSPISTDEAAALFGDLAGASVLLAVSGGPDSTALLWLAARWRKKSKAKLTAVTVDHGLRKEAKREAAAVGRLARKLGVPHRVVKWTGTKPKSGIQQAARHARYALLVAAAKKSGASHIVTAHTLDDQAETVLMRMARGSGIGGLGGMTPKSRLGSPLGDLALVRPFLDVPKSRLVATCKAAKVAYADDPSNIDPKFTRARLRPLLAVLATEGLDARRLSSLARRLRRADAAIEAMVERALAQWPDTGGVTILPIEGFASLPAEVALRVLGRAVARHASEGPVELGKLETLFVALLPAVQNPAKTPSRRTLAGAVVSLTKAELRVETAPPRRAARPLTKRRAAPPKRGKTR